MSINRLFLFLSLLNSIDITMGNKPSSQIQTCLASAVGGDSALYAFPNKPLYQLLDVHPYNLDVAVSPVAVLYPKTSDQVAAIIKCAATGYKVQARSGGHSYANFGKFSSSPY